MLFQGHLPNQMVCQIQHPVIKRKDFIRSGPSCSKHHYFNKFFCQGFVMSPSVYAHRLYSAMRQDFPLSRMSTNKRAKMALNRSPEFKSLTPKPSAAELF